MTAAEIRCWCESGLPYAQCHAVADEPWMLPAVGPLTYQWPADMDAPTQANIADYFSRFTPYQLQLEADRVEITSPPVAWTFFRQHLLAIRANGSQTFLGVPDDYVNWAGKAEPPTPSFVEDNARALAAMDSVNEIRDLFHFSRRVGRILFSSSPEDLPLRLRGVADKFLAFFPGGIIDFVTISRDWGTQPAALRSMVKTEVLGTLAAKETLAAGWTSRVLSENPYFSIMFNLFGSGQLGFVDTWIDRALLFTLDRPLGFDPVGHQLAHIRGLDQQYLPLPGKAGTRFRALTRGELRVFIAWYIARLNRLLSFMHHLGSFAERRGDTLVLSPSRSYKAILSFDQLMRLIGRIVGSDDLFVRKQLTVTLLDTMNHIGGPGGISNVFLDKFVAKVVNLLDQLPAGIRSDYVSYAKEVFARIVDEVFEGIAPNLKDGALVRLRNGPMQKDVYAGRYIAALRNTIHGYLRDPSDDYSQLLFINADKLPDSLPEIVPVLFLAFLIQPTLFFPSATFGRVLAIPRPATHS